MKPFEKEAQPTMPPNIRHKHNGPQQAHACGIDNPKKLGYTLNIFASIGVLEVAWFVMLETKKQVG